MANIKLKNNYWVTESIYDTTDSKTQKQVNADLHQDIEDLVDDVSNLNGAINTNTNAFTSWLAGKKISIIGDSIDTFDQTGYKIDGYSMFYPAFDVLSVNDTWWKRVVDASGAILEVNASYSGSYVTNTLQNVPDFYARTGSNIIGNPDVIFVTVGTNDSYNGVSVGSFDFTTAYTQLSESTFRTAYIKGVKALQNNFPNATIVCIAEKMAYSYVSSIQTIALTLGCVFIDCREYVGAQGVHPAKEGMRQIASKVIHPVSVQTNDNITENQEVNGISGRSYVKDYYILSNNILYKTTGNILVNDPIVEGVNVKRVSIGTELLTYLPMNISKYVSIKRYAISGTNSFQIHMNGIAGSGNRQVVMIMGTANTQDPIVSIIGVRGTQQPSVVNLNSNRSISASWNDDTRKLTINLPASGYDGFLAFSPGEID